MRINIGLILMLLCGSVIAADNYCRWEQRNFAIAEPLCGLTGNAQRGRIIAADQHAGNCLACHQMPIPEAAFHGTVGPPLSHVGSYYSADQIRLRIVDIRTINPNSIMPGFYRDPRKANRVADAYWGKTFLSAQQVEDLIAYLVTLK